MKFEWKYDKENNNSLKNFLKEKGVSHRMRTKMRQEQSGSININNNLAFLSDELKKGDIVTLEMPPEKGNDELLPDFDDLDIVYEDKNWLIVNKEAGVNSVPGLSDRLHTLVNKVKGYFVKNNYEDLVPHIATRLDRDTSGLVLVAKHKFSHALINDQIANREVEKFYYAVVEGELDEKHGIIDAPIGRLEGDFIKRIVREDGKKSVTEYWVEKTGNGRSLVRVQLHTGRTHQIRVHFKHIGHTLVGDELYGGIHDEFFSRQALHATELSFYDPFQNKKIFFKSSLPNAFNSVLL